MKTLLRLHRATLEQLEGPPEWNEAESEDRDRVMHACTHLFLSNPPHATTLSALADSLRISRGRLRWLFSDVDGLLGAILQQHLEDLLTAMEKAETAGDGGRAARAAYHAATRTQAGGHTPAHALYLRHRLALPPDQQALLAPIMDDIADCAAETNGALALGLFDTAPLTAEEAELAFQLILTQRERTAEASPAPAPSPNATAAAATKPPAAPAAPLPLLNKGLPSTRRAALATTSVRMFADGPPENAIADAPTFRPSYAPPHPHSILLR